MPCNSPSIVWLEEDTLAVNEVFSALLRLILTDMHTCASLSACIPKHINFASRGADLTDTDTALIAEDSFNGLRLLPRKLRPEVVKPVSWPTLLRSIMLRLPSAQHTLLYAALQPNATEELRARVTAVLSRDCVSTLSRTIGKDASAGFSTCCIPSASTLLTVAERLETEEVYSLSANEKLVLLKALCFACFDTNVVRSLLESNSADRLADQTAIDRIARESMKKREPSADRRAKVAYAHIYLFIYLLIVN